MGNYTVNLNDCAFVRLTKAGVQQFEEHWQPYPIDIEAAKRSHLQANGEWRFQLHELMLIFGPALYLGSNRLPFETTDIRFEGPKP